MNQAEEGVAKKISSRRRVAGVPITFAMTGASGLETWVKRSVAPVLWASPPVHYREVQRDRRRTLSLELHMRGSQKGPNYPRRTLVGETSGPWTGGQGPIES